MNKWLRELNWLYDLAYNVVNDANKEYTDKAYETVKQGLERLEKLEKAVKILGFVEIFDIEHDEIRYYVDGGFEPIEITKEEYDLLKEVGFRE